VSYLVSDILEKATGQEPPFKPDLQQHVESLLGGSGLGYSQLNELLLASGYDRVSLAFFRYLLGVPDAAVDGANAPTAFTSLEHLSQAIDRFRIWAVLVFGNVKYAFKYLSKLDADALAVELETTHPIDVTGYTSRHDPLVRIEQIAGAETYYLGYIVHRRLTERLEANPLDETVKIELAKRNEIVSKGKRNHEAYLTSDHMDVYVATSMRERHEYQAVSETIKAVFSEKRLEEMKIRWFDPTQAYCEDRIDKGLVEALMLRRAKCTLYLAQEADTLGKDSELASTLAQGKPVVAYVPKVEEHDQIQFAESLLKMVGGDGADERIDVILAQLRIYKPDAAWTDQTVQEWIRQPQTADVATVKQKLAESIRKHYDARATTLKDSHPLGLQVNLETGVANGVLVARTIEECSELIYRILTASLQFRLDSEKGSLVLRETVTGSVFRVVTGDKFLTNSFWNFYLTDIA
jgi:hypothetical protein